MRGRAHEGGTAHTLLRRLCFICLQIGLQIGALTTCSLDAYWLQEVEVQKMDEELGKEVLTLLALLVQMYEY